MNKMEFYNIDFNSFFQANIADKLTKKPMMNSANDQQ